MSADLNQMLYFIQVYEDKKISTAAKHLYVSQQYVSRIIQRFESELGTDLFLRTSKGLVPTEAGDKTYECFKKIIESYHTLQLQCQAQQQPSNSGTLRVVLDIGVVQLLTPYPFLSFCDNYPQIKTGLEEHRIFNCKRLVSQEEAQMGISLCIGWDAPFIHKKIHQLQTVILMAEDYPLSYKEFLTVNDLIDQPLLFSDCPSYYTILQEFDRIQKKPHIFIAINELQSIYNYLKKKTGIAPLVLNPREELPVFPKGIIPKPYKTIEPLSVYAYWNEKNRCSHLIEVYTKHLINYFK